MAMEMNDDNGSEAKRMKLLTKTDECKEADQLALTNERFNLDDLAEGLVIKKSCSVGDFAGEVGLGDKDGYLSDGPGRSKKRRYSANHSDRKKGLPWSEEEHKTFLKGLKEVGKGNWTSISKEFVRTRTPAQVASHAQKYYIRQSVPGFKKRRSSLFDLPLKENNVEIQEKAAASQPVDPPPYLVAGSSIVPHPTSHIAAGWQAGGHQVLMPSIVTPQVHLPHPSLVPNPALPLIPGFMRLDGTTMSFMPLHMNVPSQDMAAGPSRNMTMRV